jgi:hypothetical protein
LDENVAWQAIDHTYAVAIWILKYIQKHNLPVTEDETHPSFKHHMIRLNSILKTLGYKPPPTLILSDGRYRGGSSDDNVTALVSPAQIPDISRRVRYARSIQCSAHGRT